MYGYDRAPGAVVPAHGGAAAGVNAQPRRIRVAHNAMRNLGTVLVHVGGAVLRAASHSVVAHNRVTTTSRYAIQADSFYVLEGGGPPAAPGSGLNSRGNVVEYNILSDNCRLTTDAGAIEMLGSGDPALDGGGAGWWTNNTIRWNNITSTVGSSSSDGATVCVHGVPRNSPSCRDLIWGIYLDGGQSGVTVFGNIIDATLHGAVFDNAGGNNTIQNNVLVCDTTSNIACLDFGAVGVSPSQPHTPRAVSGSRSFRNVFYWRGAARVPERALPQALASQTQWTNRELKANGSDYNAYWARDFNASAVALFPGSLVLEEWQGARGGGGAANASALPLVCGGGDGGGASTLVLTKSCGAAHSRATWERNATSRRIALRANRTYVVTVDCEGDWGNCANGTAKTRLCVATPMPWAPTPPPPPVVDNHGWVWGSGAGRANSSLVAVASRKCVEVCDRGGAVGGCDGAAGSIVQLAACDGSPKQQWTLNPRDGALRTALDATLCLAAPAPPPREPMDVHSKVANPLFADSQRGDYRPTSSAVESLGFEAIPPIEAPTASCGGHTAVSCLAALRF
jgi:hypothetical protein